MSPLSLALRHTWLLVCLIVVFVLTLIPLVLLYSVAGGAYDVIATQYNHGHYSSLAREIHDGYPLDGNAAFYEHRKEIGPTFLLPYWIYSAPLFFGLPMSATLIFNFTAWSVALAAIVFLLLRNFGLPAPLAALGSIGIFLHRYGEMIQPISMQQVLPVYFFFLLIFFLWWERPKSIYRDLALVFALTLVLYGYTYMMQIIGAFVMFVFMWLLVRRDWERVRHALFVGIVMAALSIPFFTILYAQLHHPYYWETMTRTGLGFTHIPASEVLMVVIRILPFVALAYLAWKWVFDSRHALAAFAVQYFLLGASVLFVSAENVITGLDLETASHAQRFVLVWLLIGAVVAAYHLYIARSKIFALPVLKQCTLALLTLFVVLPILGQIQIFSIVVEDPVATARYQEFLPALRWLDREAEQKVVWVKPQSDLVTLVPNYTKHYLLFSHTGLLQLVSNDEMEERYLVAQSLSGLSLEKIAADVWSYRGVGAALDTPHTINRGIKICRILRSDRYEHQCGELMNSDILNAELYENMYRRYQKDIEPNLYEKLKKYNVAYIMKDIRGDQNFQPEKLPFVEEVYSDAYIAIYKIK